MNYTLDLSSYQLLVHPIIFQVSRDYGLDKAFLEQVGQLILWHIALHYPYLLLNHERLLGYFQEQLTRQLVMEA